MRAQLPGQLDRGVLRAQRFEVVAARARTRGRVCRDSSAATRGPNSRMRVDAGADRRAALRERSAAAARTDCRRAMPSSICARQPPSSWPSVTGIASIRCVRPVLTMPPTSPPCASIVSLQLLERRQQLLGDRQRGAQVDRGRNHVVAALAHVDVIVRMHGVPPAYCVARCAITSLAFMLLLVPEPVWNTSIGKLRVVPALGDLERGLLDRERTHACRGRRSSRLAPAAAHLIEPERADESARHAAAR